MKRVFWLLSAVGLTFAQSSAAQSAYSNSSTQISYTASVPDDIDSVINGLIANSQNAATRTYHQSASGTTVQNFSANFQPSFSGTERLTSNSAPSVAAAAASRAALGRSIGRCAMYVRKALQAAGYEFIPQASAYMYANGTLASAGFVKISNDNYVPQVGDIAVFNRSSKNPHGHIQIYNGTQWVSDFRQPKFSPYTQHNGYSVWRDARYNDASANTGIMFAMNEQ
ncbi:CHAP domain-containing protein [Moraxella sp. ZJ142]|uniref:CHAP domain-containing protein n=1 Tax=Moraxella marmotae TaxID=3344520 RepID=UPI0035D51DA2